MYSSFTNQSLYDPIKYWLMHCVKTIYSDLITQPINAPPPPSGLCRYSSCLQRVPHPQHHPADAWRAVRRGGPGVQQDEQRPPERRHPLRGCR